MWTVCEKLCKFWFVIREYSIRYCVVITLKNWTLKFKLLYSLNHFSCFYSICRIWCVNTRIQILRVWLKSVLPMVKYWFFSIGLFFIGAPSILANDGNTDNSDRVIQHCIQHISSWRCKNWINLHRRTSACNEQTNIQTDRQTQRHSE